MKATVLQDSRWWRKSGLRKQRRMQGELGLEGTAPPPPGREKAAGARSGVGCGDREAPALREERLRLREGGETGRVVSAAPPAPVRQPPYGPAPLAFLLRAGTAHPRPRAAPGFIPVTLTSGLKHQNAEMEPGKGVSRAAL